MPDQPPDPNRLGLSRMIRLQTRLAGDGRRYVVTADQPGADPAAPSRHIRRPALIRSHEDGQPMERDDLADMLRRNLAVAAEHPDPASPRMVELDDGEAIVIATLLDELMGLLTNDDDQTEPLGQVAREQAVMLWDRLGL